MASNTDVVKILYYNMFVLCLCLCVCMSVGNIGPYIKTRSSKFPELFTMPVAVARYSSGGIAIRHVLSVLLMTSFFRVLTNSHKNTFFMPLYTLARCMLSSCICPSVKPVSYKQLNGSSLFVLCWKEIQFSPKNYSVFLCSSLPKFILGLEKICHGKSVVLSPKFTDGRVCWPYLRRSTCGQTHIANYTSVDRSALSLLGLSGI